MSFQRIILAFHKRKEELIADAIDDIEELIEQNPQEIDELVSFAVTNLNEEEFMFFFSIVESCLTSCDIWYENGNNIRSSFYFILLKINKMVNNDPFEVNPVNTTATFNKFNLLNKRNDDSFYVPHFNNAEKVSQLPLSNFHNFFKHILLSFPNKPKKFLHKSMDLKNEELICLPLFIQEHDIRYDKPDFMERYIDMDENKRERLHKTLSKKFSIKNNQYEVLEILPALDIKGIFYQELEEFPNETED